MKIAMVGLGKMGANMSQRLIEHGHEVVAFDLDADARSAAAAFGAQPVATLQELAAALEPPRVAWVMVPAGKPTNDTITTLAGLFSSGDVVIDGGKGQLAAALEALRGSAVEVAAIGLAKQREEVFVPGRSAPLALPSDDPASLLLQRIRDEAHRFAVTFHRQRRGGDLRRASIFDELTRVGPVRRRAILEHFGSPERFIAASRDEIEQVPGLPRRVARADGAAYARTK